MISRATFLALVLLATTAPFASMPAAACGGGVRYSGQDPVYGYHYGWDEDGCAYSTGGTPCEHVRLLTVGEGVRGSDYPVGISSYSCSGSSGSHTEWEASSDAPLTQEECRFLPLVTVAGQPLPGTGQTYCVPPTQLDEERTVDSPAEIPRTGLVVMFPDSSDPSGYNYVVVSPANEITR